MTEDKEHLVLGRVKACNCELCEKDTSSMEEELVTEVEGCEIYMHKKCYERAKMLIEVFKDSFDEL